MPLSDTSYTSASPAFWVSRHQGPKPYQSLRVSLLSYGSDQPLWRWMPSCWAERCEFPFFFFFFLLYRLPAASNDVQVGRAFYSVFRSCLPDNLGAAPSSSAFASLATASSRSSSLQLLAYLCKPSISDYQSQSLRLRGRHTVCWCQGRVRVWEFDIFGRVSSLKYVIPSNL